VSAFPETRYVCDRCQVEISVAIANTPVNTRAAGAQGWLMLSIGTDPSNPPKHLCEVCAISFVEFMHEKANGSPEQTA
jgi:hypothetical protein